MSRIIRKLAWNPWGAGSLGSVGLGKATLPLQGKAQAIWQGDEGWNSTVKGMLREASCACSMGTILATMKLGIGEG